jgi:hypothetical protein
MVVDVEVVCPSAHVFKYPSQDSPPPDTQYVKYLLLSPRSDNLPLGQLEPILTPYHALVQTSLIEAVSFLASIQSQRAIELDRQLTALREVGGQRSKKALTMSFPVK